MCAQKGAQKGTPQFMRYFNIFKRVVEARTKLTARAEAEDVISSMKNLPKRGDSNKRRVFHIKAKFQKVLQA